MRRPIIVVFFSLFLLAFQALAAERGALFKVSGSGHSLYLYGTIHAGRPDFYPLEPRIRQALEAAPTLALEIDTARDPAAMAAALQQHGMYGNPRLGLAGLAPERRQRIETALKRQGLDPAALKQLKPWMIVMTLAVIDAAKMGYDPRLGVDSHLAEQARSKGKTRIAELESIGYQAALLDRLKDEDQWKLLEETLEHMASGRQLRESRELFDAYERADQAALERIAQRMEEDDSISGKFMRELLMDERNGPMADKIVSLLGRENNAVVAVGLLHLVGKRGVPELLRKRGIKVERIY
ncbi:TraB/GumN family protein [Massilia sp. IC2-476]|uniref:TraB/GumN family protein n=1 Tax=Massilia sp. IC2-476 TaxID=2887199 RepID=UPI001D11E309|nr:TraB/GumN family protein [Massilia sp. IC2-476]MCC2972969.1 TraB/GumN family protein [Massilia sp. IC2-476]